TTGGNVSVTVWLWLHRTYGLGDLLDRSGSGKNDTHRTHFQNAVDQVDVDIAIDRFRNAYQGCYPDRMCGVNHSVHGFGILERALHVDSHVVQACESQNLDHLWRATEYVDAKRW